MARHRSPGSQPPPVPIRGDPDFFPARRGLPAPPPTLRGRTLVAAVAAGACVGAALSAEQAGALTKSPKHPSANQSAAHAPAVRPIAMVKRLPGRTPASSTGRAVRPTTGPVVSWFGSRRGEAHHGVDFAGTTGTPVLAATGGRVAGTGSTNSGTWLRIQHSDGTSVLYDHLTGTVLRPGQRVTAGDRIAAMSGSSNLHFEVRDSGGINRDPMVWLHERGVTSL